MGFMPEVAASLTHMPLVQVAAGNRIWCVQNQKKMEARLAKLTGSSKKSRSASPHEEVRVRADLT